MKTTHQVIEYLATHPFLKKGFNKLNKADLDFLVKFFNEGHETKGEAAMAANRLFLDMAVKPKNWKIICELASCGVTWRYL